jgi:hypothetical protein
MWVLFKEKLFMVQVVDGHTTGGGNVQALLQKAIKMQNTILFLVSNSESIP